jgi:hypothetical protein
VVLRAGRTYAQGMALLYQAELRPSKIDLIAAWAPTQPWFEGDTAAAVAAADTDFVSVASYRFDDPEGEVGIETLLVRHGNGPVLQVPLTYRGAPLEGGEAWLIGTMDHSVLGPRWVYDGAGDPAYLAAVATAAIGGGSQAEQVIDIDGERVVREPTARVQGSGLPGTPLPARPSTDTLRTRSGPGTTTVDAGSLHVVVARVIGDDTSVNNFVPSREPQPGVRAQAVITGTWTAQLVPGALVLIQVDVA